MLEMFILYLLGMPIGALAMLLLALAGTFALCFLVPTLWDVDEES